jgi:hypothetical protein
MTLALWVYGVGVVVSLFGGAWLCGRLGDERLYFPALLFLAVFWPAVLPMLALQAALSCLHEQGLLSRYIAQNNK